MTEEREQTNATRAALVEKVPSGVYPPCDQHVTTI